MSTDRPDNVKPFPGTVPVGSISRAIVDAMARSVSTFTTEHGEAAAYAMVLRTADGTADTFWLMDDGICVRDFLARAGAMLTADAMDPDNQA